MIPIPDRATLSTVSPSLATSLQRAARRAAAIPAIGLVDLTPDALLTEAIRTAIAAVERQGPALRRCLALGPYEAEGPIPADLIGKRTPDEDCDTAITMLYAHAINSFKGQIAEVLALGACARLVRDLRKAGVLSRGARLYFGDAVKPRGSHGYAKGADFHVLSGTEDAVVLEGVGEVKSFVAPPSKLDRQLRAHAKRAAAGLRITGDRPHPISTVPRVARGGPLRFSVSLSDWKLSRKFHFEDRDGRSFLHGEGLPPVPPDQVLEVGARRWHVTLGWSQEALAAEAYGLTFWYMEQLGADIFAEPGSSPWPGMTPEQAGANAATQSLYHAIARCTSRRSEQRAIALYNAYGFGYALGTSYKDKTGRRHMLWAEDLRQILESGESRDGCRLRC